VTSRPGGEDQIEVRAGPLARLVVGLVLIVFLSISVIAGDLFSVAFFLAYGLTGLLLAFRGPRNPIMALLLGIGCAMTLGTLRAVEDPAGLIDGTAPLNQRMIAWGSSWGFTLAIGLLFILTLLFPSGRVRIKYRRLTLTAIMVSVTGLLVTAVGPNIDVAPAVGPPISIANPFALAPTSSLWNVLPSNGFWFVVESLLLSAGVAVVVGSYMRATGLLRLQFRWLTAAISIVGIGTVVGLLSASAMGLSEADPRTAGLALFLVWAPALLGLLGVPVAIAIAVLRYRLFEIDRLISRSLGYFLVVATLGSVYALGAVWLPTRLVGRQPPLFVAGSTLLVAVLFNPLRRRVLTVVDRRFNRSRYDIDKVVEEFSGRLRSRTDLETLTDDWVSVVIKTMQPSTLGIWVKSDGTKGGTPTN
jgi:hypothetical protein